MASLLAPTEQARRAIEALKVGKVLSSGGDNGQVRAKRALTLHEADKALRNWEQPTTPADAFRR
jgi:hypothetical protein